MTLFFLLLSLFSNVQVPLRRIASDEVCIGVCDLMLALSAHKTPHSRCLVSVVTHKTSHSRCRVSVAARSVPLPCGAHTIPPHLFLPPRVNRPVRAGGRARARAHLRVSTKSSVQAVMHALALTCVHRPNRPCRRSCTRLRSPACIDQIVRAGARARARAHLRVSTKSSVQALVHALALTCVYRPNRPCRRSCASACIILSTRPSVQALAHALALTCARTGTAGVVLVGCQAIVSCRRSRTRSRSPARARAPPASCCASSRPTPLTESPSSSPRPPPQGYYPRRRRPPPRCSAWQCSSRRSARR